MEHTKHITPAPDVRPPIDRHRRRYLVAMVTLGLMSPERAARSLLAEVRREGEADGAEGGR